MTEAQRIGQLFAISLPHAVLDDRHRAAIAAWHFGSVWLGRTTVGVAALRTVANGVQALATKATTDRVRFLIGANQEGGLIQGLSGPGFTVIPSALDQGRMSSATLASAAKTWGNQLRSAGINLNFAPVADTVPSGTGASNAPIGQLKREYGHQPLNVANHVAAFIDGMHAAGVATTAKHFPGLGRVKANTDDAANVTDSVTTSHDAYLGPFKRAIAEGVPIVMVSLATYERIDPSNIAAFSHTIIHGLLRTTLAFHGVIASDSLTAEAVKSVPATERAVRFLNAGGDLIVVGTLAPAITMARGLAASAAANPSFAKVIDSAARRVLREKVADGLVSCSG
jgi:beta-N-acetylhexosaminidase